MKAADASVEPTASCRTADGHTRAARPMEISVRREVPADWSHVEDVVRDAFGRAEEAQLVGRLRAFESVLSLVAHIHGTLVGHAMFSPVKERRLETLSAGYALAPVAVSREWQRRGIGSRLIDFGLQELRRSGVGLVVVLGHASYYPRFGFVAAGPLGLRCKWGGEQGTFQVLELAPGTAAEHRGLVDYHPIFEETAW